MKEINAAPLSLSSEESESEQIRMCKALADEVIAPMANIFGRLVGSHGHTLVGSRGLQYFHRRPLHCPRTETLAEFDATTIGDPRGKFCLGPGQQPRHSTESSPERSRTLRGSPASARGGLTGASSAKNLKARSASDEGGQPAHQEEHSPRSEASRHASTRTTGGIARANSAPPQLRKQSSTKNAGEK